MITWNDLRHADVREEILDEEKYSVVGRNLSSGKTLKADAIVISLEFAKTLSGDMQKILKELGVI